MSNSKRRDKKGRILLNGKLRKQMDVINTGILMHQATGRQFIVGDSPVQMQCLQTNALKSPCEKWKKKYSYNC